MRPLVELDYNTLTNLATNTGTVEAFPFLSDLAAAMRSRTPKKAGCGSCGSVGRDLAQAVNRTKDAFMALADADKRRLLERLDARSIRITRVTKGKVVRHTVKRGG